MRETSAGQTVSGREIRDLSRCNCRTASVPHFSTGIWGPQPRRHPGRWRCRGDPAPPAAPQGPGRLRPGRDGAEGSGRRAGPPPRAGGGWGLFPGVGACSWLLGLVPGGCGLFTVVFVISAVPENCFTESFHSHRRPLPWYGLEGH